MITLLFLSHVLDLHSVIPSMQCYDIFISHSPSSFSMSSYVLLEVRNKYFTVSTLGKQDALSQYLAYLRGVFPPFL